MRGKFKNLYPHEIHRLGALLYWKFLERIPVPGPYSPPRTERSEPGPPVGTDSVTWIGHSSFQVRLGGKSLLFDPVFSDYCAPFPIRRLKRRAPPGLSLGGIGPVDAVLVSHNHYDHLDWPTVRALPKETSFIVPTNLSPWFRSRGRRNVRELGWWQTTEVCGLKITSVPAQHFSSRTPWDRDRTLWCGWLVQSSGRTVYFAGDTGYCPVFRDIGARHGPIDLAMIPIGAYAPRWFMKPMHVGPEEAVQIHMDVRSRLSVGCHWGTFCLTDEPMDEPPKLLAQVLEQTSIAPEQFRTLRIGETLAF